MSVFVVVFGVFVVDHVVDGVGVWDVPVFVCCFAWWMVVPYGDVVCLEEVSYCFPFVVEGAVCSFDLFSVVAVSYPVLVLWVVDVYGYGVFCDVFEKVFSFVCGAWAVSESVDHVEFDVV